MLASRPAAWKADNWRNTASATPTPRLILALPDGSYLPLIQKQEGILAIDTTNGLDLQNVFHRLATHAFPAGHGHVPTGYAGSQHSTPVNPGITAKGDESRANAYQQRIDELVAGCPPLDRQLGNHASLSHPRSPFTSAASVAPANGDASFSRYAHRPSHTSDKKEYCTHWIHHGECDFEQQGCRYKHEMPGLPWLKQNGFSRGYPKWWQEKEQRERAAVMRKQANEESLRAVIGKQLGSSSDSDAGSDDGGQSDAYESEASEVERKVVVPAPTVRERGVATSLGRYRVEAVEKAKSQVLTPASSSSPIEENVRDVPQATRTRATETSPIKKETHILDMSESDSERTLTRSTKPSPAVPHNSPEDTPLRHGRFIAHNDRLDLAAPTRVDSSMYQHYASPTPSKMSLVSAEEDEPIGYQSKESSADAEIRELRKELAALKGSTVPQHPTTDVPPAASKKTSGGLAQSRFATVAASAPAQLSVGPSKNPKAIAASSRLPIAAPSKASRAPTGPRVDLEDAALKPMDRLAGGRSPPKRARVDFTPSSKHARPYRGGKAAPPLKQSMKALNGLQKAKEREGKMVARANGAAVGGVVSEAKRLFSFADEHDL